ncbi:MAG: hypothetical protein AB7T08_00705 [Hyphomonadaceae bacterium]
MLWIEGLVALIVMLAFFVSSFFLFNAEQVAHHPGRVRAGAAIQGLIIGLILGFVIVPLRMTMMSSAMDGPPNPYASLSILPAFILLILVRRGALLRAPVIKTYLRAYRRAMLNRTRDEALKQIAKLDEIEGRSASGEERGKSPVEISGGAP